MRIWIDITDAAHVVFFAPVVRRLEDDGHSVTLTARRFAGADTVLRRYGLGGVLTTTHRGGGTATRLIGLVNRTAQLLGLASSGRHDVAAGSHASDFVITARLLGVPVLTFLDDERVGRANAVNLRLADEVAVPEAIPVADLVRLGAAPQRLFRYPGFREEYYLYDEHPGPDVLAGLGVDRRKVVGVVRPAPRPWPGGERRDEADRPLRELVAALAARPSVTLVVLARDEAQRRRYAALGRSLVVPGEPLDAVALVAAADFALGHGGTVLREAAALGTPAYTVAGGPLPAVERALLADGRLRRARRPEDLVLRKKDPLTTVVPPRDPRLFAARIVSLGRRGAGRLTAGVTDETGPPPLT